MQTALVTAVNFTACLAVLKADEEQYVVLHWTNGAMRTGEVVYGDLMDRAPHQLLLCRSGKWVTVDKADAYPDPQSADRALHAWPKADTPARTWSRPRLSAWLHR